MGWGDFLEFLELFFNGEMWCDMLLKILRLFLIEKGDVAWAYFLKFLELFFNREMWYDMLLEFSELFFNGERWCDMWWFH
jgi:hypothetical protein